MMVKVMGNNISSILFRKNVIKMCGYRAKILPAERGLLRRAKE